MSVEESMPCPRCKKMHAKGEYGPRPELATKPLGKVVEAATRKHGSEVRSGTPYAPPDVTCDCGAVLRHSVPLFKVDAFGWHWRIM